MYEHTRFIGGSLSLAHAFILTLEEPLLFFELVALMAFKDINARCQFRQNTIIELTSRALLYCNSCPWKKFAINVDKTEKICTGSRHKKRYLLGSFPLDLEHSALIL